jgi:O-antigen ligase
MLSSMVTPSHVATMGLLLVSGIWATVLFKVGTARTATRDATLTTFLLWVLGLTPVLVQLVSPRAFLTRFDITTQDTGVVALGVRVSQIGTLVAMGISAVILLSPGKSNTSRRPALALVAFYLTAFFSAVLGSHGGVGRPILLAPLAMLALAFGQRPSPDSLLHHLRWITRVYTWGSLVYQDTSAERNYFGVGQLVGLTPHPNVLGPIAATALLLELTRRARRPGWWINAGAAAGVLLLAQSRTSWLAAAVAIVAMALAPTPGRRRGRTSAALTSALVASIASILAVPTVQTFVANLTGNRDLTTGNGRTLAFHYAYAEYEKNKLFGYGPSIFSPEYRARFLGTDLGWLGQAHNQVVQSLAEGGLLALFALLMVFLSFTRAAWASRRIYGALPVGLATLLLVRGMGEASLRNRAYDALFFTLVAAVMVVMEPTADNPASAASAPAQEPGSQALSPPRRTSQASPAAMAASR